MKMQDPSLFPTGTTDRQVGLLPLWHVLDVAPFVEINTTIGWEEPVRITSTYVGWLLLVGKLIFVLTIVEFGKSAIQRFRNDSPTQGLPPAVSP